MCAPSFIGNGVFCEALAAGRDHLRGMLQAGVSDLCAAQHARDFVSASPIVEHANLRFGATVIFAFLNGEMLIGKRGDLREMSDAENLLRASESFELLANGFCSAAADADIDFVEDERARRGFLSGFGRGFFDGDFECEQNSRELAAGCDLSQRLQRFSRIGGNAVLDRVQAGGGPSGFRIARGDGDVEANFHGQRVDLRFGKLGELLPGGLALSRKRGRGFAVGLGSLF
jgi:hypothetical protein